jgi:hypothetical protein
VPRGPRNWIACVATGAQFSTPAESPACAARPLAAAVDAAAAPVVVLSASASDPHAASSAAAAVAPRPSRPSRRIASRRVMMPSAWSSATSSAR